MPGLAGERALITLDNGHDHTQPDHVRARRARRRSDAALDEIAADHAVGDRRHRQAVHLRRRRRPLRLVADRRGRAGRRGRPRPGTGCSVRLKDSAVPTFAFVNGAALGGGLELALHCHYRTVATTAVGRASPRSRSGSSPAGAARRLLPNLIGIDHAVTVIVGNPLAQNKIMPAPKAAPLGIADVVFDAADFLERSLSTGPPAWSAATSPSRGPDVDRSAWDDAICRATAIVAGRTGNASPQRRRGRSACSTWPGPHSRRRASPRAPRPRTTPTDLLTSAEPQAALYAFDLVKKRAKRPAGAPDRKLARKVTKVGVVGAGLMAAPARPAGRAAA